MSEPLESGQNDTPAQLKAVMDGIGSLATALGEEMTKDPVVKGLHKTDILTQPVTDAYGSFTKRWQFTEGCLPLDQLRNQADEVQCTIADNDGNQRVVSLGRTPSALNPAQGGRLIADAGNAGEYLMAVGHIDASGRQVDPSTVKYRYLDAGDLKDVQLRHGEAFLLAANTARNRQVTIPGLINSTTALLP